jgi:YD repeat-containing protein
MPPSLTFRSSAVRLRTPQSNRCNSDRYGSFNDSAFPIYLQREGKSEFYRAVDSCSETVLAGHGINKGRCIVAKRRFELAIATLMIAAVPALAMASETINYSYDAKGRLVQVARSGTVNNGVVTNYVYDKADNRVNKNTTGSSNPGPP